MYGDDTVVYLRGKGGCWKVTQWNIKLFFSKMNSSSIWRKARTMNTIVSKRGRHVDNNFTFRINKIITVVYL